MRRAVVLVATGLIAGAATATSCADQPGGDAAGRPDGSAGDDSEGGPPPPAPGPAAPATDAGGDADAEGGRPLVDTCGDAGVVPGAWVADPRLCLTIYADANSVGLPRQFAFAPNGDLFVVSSGAVIAASDVDKDGVITGDEATNFTAILGLTHSVVFSPDGAYVYASTDTTVYRWAYTAGDHVARGVEQIVVSGIPTGGHVTRTLAFDSTGRLYVNVGSSTDVESDPALIATRAQIRRFTIPAVLPSSGVTYDTGEVYAPGVRNEVGLHFDSKGRFWGVENGSDGTYQAIDGTDNPAEELNRLDTPGPRFYGYPYCLSEFAFAGGLGAGTQWAYVGNPDPHTDGWCRDPKNVTPPAFAMQGHWAPLGVAEYTGGSLPWKGDLFIASHGSIARTVPIGRLLARAHLVGDTVVSVTPVVGELGPDGGLTQGTWESRPVDVRTGPDGALYFSDNGAGRIYRLGYRP
jgi:glucose/arabinose dehydrogenase